MATLFQSASAQLKDALVQNMVSIAEEYQKAGADIVRIVSTRGSHPSVTVIGKTEDYGQPIIEVDFTKSMIESTVRSPCGLHTESRRKPGSVQELLDVYRGHMAFYFGHFDVPLAKLNFKANLGME